MHVRQATRDEVATILEIIDQARSIMRESGNMTQWSNGYPSSEVILGDIISDEGFVCEVDGKIVGYFCFQQGQNPDSNYDVIENGKWLNDEPYGVIHRLASARTVKGIANAAFDYAFSKIGNIRVDTHHENVPMQNFLVKSGFEYCGVIYVSDGTPRDAFQKTLK
ncbi:GNAT family N-acetyltransferase [Flavobacterium sp. MAH-1]|uniref:GNAT family N-acetyltransferase n=1 Tax=Flavobacterium agri TaxID=2743471 RepID=A0A7Y9C8K8_9FLAO|nr:GNAT family N-acetyltransferase [Flavobacterium agri]NUY82565.1 GNAT family N-acetyltransferase [Flavobacterium agri]NYA72588.1 GNAT family N-acetyltransferase [Flavobacterium agri]